MITIWTAKLPSNYVDYQDDPPSKDMCCCCFSVVRGHRESVTDGDKGGITQAHLVIINTHGASKQTCEVRNNFDSEMPNVEAELVHLKSTRPEYGYFILSKTLH